MEIINEVAASMIGRGEIKLILSPEVAMYAESRCMEILDRIRQIVSDDTLDDPECFRRIEAVICEFERYGIDCGQRHDFG